MGIRTKRIYQKRTKLAIKEHDRRVDLGATEKQLQLVARAKLIWTRGDHVEIQRSNYSAIVPSVCRTDWTTTAIPAARKQLNQLTMYKRDRGDETWTRDHRITSPGGVLAEKLGRSVRPASQNPYPIYDQNLRFSLPYLWPNEKFDTLFMTWPLNQYPVSDLPYNYFPSFRPMLKAMFICFY